MVTVGISTNTRLLGLAVITQNALVDYSIRLHKSSWSPSKADLILASLEPCVRQYCIKRVILSSPHAYHQTKAGSFLLSRIKAFFETKNIPVSIKGPKAIYPLYRPGQKKTKKELMNVVCNHYPQLVHCQRKELRNKNKYYYKVFEAVAVAMAHQ